MIRWETVEVAYGGRRVLGPLSLTVAGGEWVGVIGPNGAGKSTLLRAAVGLVPHDGRVLLGEEAPRPGEDLAWMPQRPSMPEEMGVADYVMLGRSPHIGYLGREGWVDRRAVEEALARLDLSQISDRPLGTLSGGEAQRVFLARALAQGAPVLLLDEPTANLDIGHAIEVLEVVDDLRQSERLTVITAIHDLTMAGRFCTRLALLGDGALMADGSPREVLTEAILRPHYGDNLRVVVNGEGPTVIPARPRS